MAVAVLALAKPSPLVPTDARHVVAPRILFCSDVAFRAPGHLVHSHVVQQLLIQIVLTVALVPVLLTDEAEFMPVRTLHFVFPVGALHPKLAVWERAPLLVLVHVHFDVRLEFIEFLK